MAAPEQADRLLHDEYISLPVQVKDTILIPISSPSGPLVDIYVGPENTQYEIHEELLCSKSDFFSKMLCTLMASKRPKRQKTLNFPDEEEGPFNMFVSWLYLGQVMPLTEEPDLDELFDLYLMSEKWQIPGLSNDTLECVRRYYRTSNSFPGLRRVQYIYANTSEGSAMRELLVGCVARMLILVDSMPAHWERALKKNGELAVDIIKAMQAWRMESVYVPDVREIPK